MNFLVTLLMPMMCVLAHEIRQGSRVIAGKDANYKDYSFFGLVVFKIEVNFGAPEFFCGASLISDYFFLTAAHCMVEYQQPHVYGIIMGVENNCILDGYEILIDVDSISFPPGFIIVNDLDKDIALLKTKVEVVGYNKILLPRKPISTGQVGTLIGFGSTADPELPGGPQFSCTLKQTPQKILPNDECYLEFDNTFCARGTESNDSSSCIGDSGNPWMTQNVDPNGVTYEITGIVSSGHFNCDAKGFCNIMTDVLAHVKWINEVIA